MIVNYFLFLGESIYSDARSFLLNANAETFSIYENCKEDKKDEDNKSVFDVMKVQETEENMMIEIENINKNTINQIDKEPYKTFDIKFNEIKENSKLIC